LDAAAEIKPMVADVSRLLNEAQAAGRNLLFEGAQGALLDIDHGTYPYVTSSNCVAGAAAAGAGIGPRQLHYVLGVTKAYATRVGSGPFPTELDNDIGQRLASRGNEFGATTGRPRRCGWFDAAALKRSIQLSGISGLGVTKLDVLDGMESVRLAVGYRMKNSRADILPAGADALEGYEPIYEEMPGWKDSTVGLTRFAELPRAARNYLRRIEKLLGVPIDVISTGPERAQTIVLRHPFK
jgi:adenylosuccinate synthase